MVSLNVKIHLKDFPANLGLWRNISRRILSHKQKSHPVLQNFELKALPGECIGIVGDNGSGKSTLLRCLADILPYQGEKNSIGKLLCVLSHGLGAYDDLPLARNAELILQLYGLDQSQARKSVDEVLSWAGLEGQNDRVFSHLSEGQRARLPLAALKLASFDILLLDESLNYIDQSFRDKFYALTRDWLKAGKIIILTSHDNTNIDRFCTRTVKLPC